MLSIEFDTANAAFHFDGEEEDVDETAVAETIRYVADRIAYGHTSGPVIDPNGNTVGHWSLDASA